MPPNAAAVDPAHARRNAILNTFTDAQLASVLPDLQVEPLPVGLLLFEPGVPLTAVRFLTIGVASVLAVLEGGEQVEVATVGYEGMIGLSVFLGAPSPTERSVVQVAGSALTMSADAFARHVADLDGPLPTMLRRYAQATFTQLARNAACNRVHSVRQRAARWLLMTSDRMDSATFELTQDFLAQMLAVRRPTVSEVAQSLAHDGAISYVRGVITVLDRDKLHATACGCYDAVRIATANALS